MYKNKTVLEGIRQVLAERGTTLDAWEIATFWEKGSTQAALTPPDAVSLNRNIRLLVHKLDIELTDFLDRLKSIESGER